MPVLLSRESDVRRSAFRSKITTFDAYILLVVFPLPLGVCTGGGKEMGEGEEEGVRGGIECTPSD